MEIMTMPMTRTTRRKKERSPFETLKDADRAILAKLPAGVPTLGLHWSEVKDYFASFQDFRKAILAGELFNDRHCWLAVAKFKGTILVKEDGKIEARDEEDEALIKVWKKTGVIEEKHQYRNSYFVIDDEFITRAWTIGVHRGGLWWFEKGDVDLSLQYARYGFINQG
jgi:hypothetical protein